jgi:hypothetical protein
VTATLMTKQNSYLVPGRASGPVPSVHLSEKVLLVKNIIKKHCECANGAAERISVRKDKIIVWLQSLWCTCY